MQASEGKRRQRGMERVERLQEEQNKFAGSVFMRFRHSVLPDLVNTGAEEAEETSSVSIVWCGM